MMPHPPLSPVRVSEGPLHRIIFYPNMDTEDALNLTTNEFNTIRNRSPIIKEILDKETRIIPGKAKKSHLLVTDSTGRCDASLVRRLLDLLKSANWPESEFEDLRLDSELYEAFKAFKCNSELLETMRESWLKQYHKNGGSEKELQPRFKAAASRVSLALELEWDDVLMWASTDLVVASNDPCIGLEKQLKLPASTIDNLRSACEEKAGDTARLHLWHPSLNDKQKSQLKKWSENKGIGFLWDFDKAQGSKKGKGKGKRPVSDITPEATIYRTGEVLDQYCKSLQPKPASNQSRRTGGADVLGHVFRKLSKKDEKTREQTSKFEELSVQLMKEWDEIKTNEGENLARIFKEYWTGGTE